MPFCVFGNVVSSVVMLRGGGTFKRWDLVGSGKTNWPSLFA